MTKQVPRDLITSTEAKDQLGIGYSRLRDWWQRGVIRSWGVGRRRLVSRAEVRRVMRRRDVPRELARKGYMGPLEDQSERPEPPAPAVPTAHPALPERAPGWTPAGPWGYTGE